MRKFLTVFVVFLVLLTSGCVRNVQSTAGQATPFQKAVAYNVSLAETNQAVALSVITLNTNSVLNDGQAQSILSVQKDIALVDIQITNILNQGPSYTQANASQLFSLINSLSSSAKNLESQGVIPNNTNTKQIQLQVDSVISIAQLIITQLNLAGVQ